MSDKVRADLLMVGQGLAESREQAQRLIESGAVTSQEGRTVRKPSEKFLSEMVLTCAAACPYVSRGAYKLLPALDRFLPDLTGKTGLDIGASTGGFTDVMCQRGAAKIYAVDCGRGQLHPKLAHDSRVVSMEKCNARDLTPVMFDAKADVMTMDVSFISVTLIIPALAPLMTPGAFGFVLVKPQFECGRALLGKNGVVKLESTRLDCVQKVVQFAEKTVGWRCHDVLPSPIKGPQGNQEYVAVFQTPDSYL